MSLMTACITSMPGRSAAEPGILPPRRILLRSQQLRPSIMVAFSLGPGWRAFGPAVIRVRTAKSAVAGDHLLHAHFVGWQTAIVMKGMARTSARAPRHLSGLADAKVEQHCHRYGHHDEHESHVASTRMIRADLCLDPSPHGATPYYYLAANTRIARPSVVCPPKALRSGNGCIHLALRSHRHRNFAEAHRAERCPTSSYWRVRYRAAIDPYRTTDMSYGCRRVFAVSRRSARDRSRASRPKLRIRRDCE